MESVLFDRDTHTVTVAVAGKAVRFDLSRSDVRAYETQPGAADRAFQGWVVSAVHAPVDDRRLIFEFSRPGRFKGSAERRATLEVSALPTARGAVLRNAGGARLGGIGSAPPPPVAPRPVLTDDELIAACRAADHERLLAGRWMSPLMARLLCAEPELAGERYHLICSDAPARPSRCAGRVVAFPLCDGAVPVASLVEPIPPAAGATELRVDPRRERARARMAAELERAHDAPLVRAVADALLPLGAEPAPLEVTLASGASAAVPARPGETSADVAARLYAEARSKERALAALPARLGALAAAVSSGAPAVAPHSIGKRAAAPRLPYRTYRSSGGLEIWVGRGASSNDELTFHAAAPNDVWLHAQDVTGAHVVLRWSKSDAPPARDLHEAALLAAWHSRSRGAAVVPVDWTRRKHVRKPRGAKAGSVSVQGARTIMVHPDRDVERRLRPPT